MPGDSRPPFERGETAGKADAGAQSRGGRPRKTPEVRAAEEWGKGGGTPENPGGRPLDVIKQLFADATNKGIKPSERTAAADKFLDRIMGKPMQAHEISGPDGDPLLPQFDFSSLSDEEAGQLLKLLRAARAKPTP